MRTNESLWPAGILGTVTSQTGAGSAQDRGLALIPILTPPPTGLASPLGVAERVLRMSCSSPSRERVSDEDGSDVMVSPSRYSMFRNTVRTSKGTFTLVNPGGEGFRKASRSTCHRMISPIRWPGACSLH